MGRLSFGRKSENGEKKPKKVYTFRISSTGLVIVIAIIAVVAAYFVGHWQGEKKQKPLRPTAIQRGENSDAQNRWTAVGTIEDVNDSSIKVKDSKNEIKTGTITKDTSIVNRKGDKLAPKDLKKAQRVIVSGTKDGDKLTAVRIRLQD